MEHGQQLGDSDGVCYGMQYGMQYGMLFFELATDCYLSTVGESTATGCHRSRQDD